MNKKNSWIMLVFLFSLVLVSANEGNLSVKDQATLCLQESVKIIEELQNSNFSIVRANDTFKQADNLYLSQTLLEQKGRQGEFELVLPYCETLIKLKEDAYSARDSFQALKRFYDESFDNANIDTSSVDLILVQIEDEITSERYEKVPALVTKAYEEIIQVKSEYSTLNLFYSSTTRSLKKFFLDHWKTMIISLSSLLLLFLIYRSSIHRALIKKKIESLIARKESLKRLIMKTQKEYFEGNNMSESTYTIRTKSFAEMIRDIDRQIPLLQERLFIYSGGRSREEALYVKKDDKHQNKEKKQLDKQVKEQVRKLQKEVKKETKNSWKNFKKTHKTIKKIHKKKKTE